ncbi:MAG: hypothetical protein DRN03_03700 [Thermoplasmata archaeon]|nr:MAG: hypothetical protein DRN03_03700 [Thermoplasmata archaeon]
MAMSMRSPSIPFQGSNTKPFFMSIALPSALAIPPPTPPRAGQPGLFIGWGEGRTDIDRLYLNYGFRSVEAEKRCGGNCRLCPLYLQSPKLTTISEVWGLSSITK